MLKEVLRQRASKRVLVIDTLGEHGKGRQVIKTPGALVKAVMQRTFDIAVQFEDALDGFSWACRAAYAAEDLILVCEEVDYYIKANYAPPPFSLLVRYGRHKGVEMVCVSRRPPDMWRNLTANANNIIAFRTVEPRDVRYLAEFIGEKTAARLRELKTLEYIRWSDGEVSRGRTSF